MESNVDTDDRTHRDRDFAAFFHEHFPAIRNRVSYCVRNAHRTEEICADVFTLAYQRFDELRDLPVGHARGWLIRAGDLIGKNVTRSAIRRERLIARLEREPMPPAPPPDEVAECRLRDAHQQVLRRRAQVVLNELDPKHRRLIELADFERQSAPEIANELGVTPQAVRLRLMRARRAFRSQYLDMYGADDSGAFR